MKRDRLRRQDERLDGRQVASSLGPGVAVTGGGGGGGGGGNADTVGGFPASGVPLPGHLLALDANAQFPESVIRRTDYVPMLPGGGVDAVMLTGWGEFDYGTALVGNSAAGWRNGVLGSRVLGQSPPAQADILYVLDRDLPRLSTVRTVVMWMNRYTQIGGTSANATPKTANDGRLYPALSQAVRDEPAWAPSWSVDGYSSSEDVNVLVHPGPGFGDFSGTPSEVHFLQAARALASRGYDLGVVVVPLMVDYATGTDTWRGWYTWTSDSAFATWVADYEAAVQRQVSLLVDAGLPPVIVYLASEMPSSTCDSNTARYTAWIEAIQRLATWCKARVPGVHVTYAADWTEYGYRENLSAVPARYFSADPIWSHPDVDSVGIDAYLPVGSVHSNDARVLRQHLRMGEQVEYWYSGINPANRALQATNRSGKAGLTRNALDPAYGLKNLAAFRDEAHYEPAGAGVLASPSPWGGGWRGRLGGLGSMNGTGVLAKTSALVAAPGHGVRPVPRDRDTWLSLDGTQWARFGMPVGTATRTYAVELDYRWQAGTVSYPRLLRIPGALDVFVDVPAGTTVKAAVVHAGGTAFSEGLPIVSGQDYRTRIEVAGSVVRLVHNGTEVAPLSLGGTAIMPASGGSAFAGCWDESNDRMTGRLYYLDYRAGTARVPLGGRYWFEEVYAGVRTAWEPRSKPVIATEMGYASMNGSCVEPNVFPTPVVAPGPDLFPSWFEDAAYWRYWQTRGLPVVDILGPYGSDFRADEYHQLLLVNLTAEAYRGIGIEHAVLYNLETRPAASLLARLPNGQLYYTDGPRHRINHAVNDKLAGGGGGFLLAAGTLAPPV